MNVVPFPTSDDLNLTVVELYDLNTVPAQSRCHFPL
jgi:hypothetical protein